MHCLEPRASLWLRMSHSCCLPPQSSLLCMSSSGSEATVTAIVLTASYLLSVPTDVPSDNACEVGWEVIFQELPKSKEVVLLSSDVKNSGYYCHSLVIIACFIWTIKIP